MSGNKESVAAFGSGTKSVKDNPLRRTKHMSVSSVALASLVDESGLQKKDLIKIFDSKKSRCTPMNPTFPAANKNQIVRFASAIDYGSANDRARIEHNPNMP
jgi:hypothetical protein